MPKITKKITIPEAEKIIVDFLEECKLGYDGYIFTCAELLETIKLHTPLNLSEAELSIILKNLLDRGLIKNSGIISGEVTYAIVYS